MENHRNNTTKQWQEKAQMDPNGKNMPVPKRQQKWEEKT